MKKFIFAVMVVLPLCCTASAFATAIVSLVPSVDGQSWTLQATGFEKISAIDLTITYNTSILSNPTVKQGSFLGGSLLAPNATTPGIVRIAIATDKALTGSGPLATLSFQRKAGGAANLKLVSMSAIGEDLAPKPIVPENPPAEGTDQTPSEKGSPVDRRGAPVDRREVPVDRGSSTVVMGGTVTLPSDMAGTREEKKTQQTSPEDKEEHHEAPSVARQAAAPEVNREVEPKPSALKVEPQKSILGLFKGYKGEMTSNALISLFAVDEKAIVKQDPPILLADGKANLKLTIQNPQSKHAPNFALKKAKLVSLKVASNNTWIVVAKPEKGVYDASITMLVDDTAVEMPLTVAPKVDIDLDKSGKIDENDFKIFLQDRGSSKVPKNDLNKDGRRDHIDDYIFTANFLVLNPKAKEKQVTGKVPVETKQNRDAVPGNKPHTK